VNGLERDLGVESGVSGEVGWKVGVAASSMEILAGEGSEESCWKREVDLIGNWELSPDI
jgi:hypothetical protein